MATNLKLIVALGLFAFVLSKKTNAEELDLEEKNTKAREFMDLFNNEEDNSRNQRYARHLQAVTESVLDHVLNEIRHEYIQKNYNKNSPIRRLIQTLNGQMKKEHETKLAKEKLEKETAKKITTKTVKGKKKKMPKKKKTPTKKKLPRKKKRNPGIKSITPKKITDKKRKERNWRDWRSNIQRDV